MNDRTAIRSDLLRPAILATAGFILGLVLTCIAPFAAVAAIGARTLPLRVALAVVGAMWFANQLVGFTFFHYPYTASTFALGLAIGVAAVAGTLVAARIAMLPLAFLAAFATYELVQVAFALAFGGSNEFTFAIVLEILEANALGYVILAALDSLIIVPLETT